MSVVFTEDLWVPVPAWFESRYPVIYDPTLVGDRELLLTRVRDAEALVVRNRTRVDEDLLQSAPLLRVVGRLGVGLDNIDVDACRDRNVQIVTARGCNGDAVAEYVLACMLFHSRFLHRVDDDVRAGHWNRLFATGNEIGGKTLGLIGAGDIARRVARRALACGMNVVGFDPYLDGNNVEIALTDFASVLDQSDYISIHVPLTNETHHLVGEDEFFRMKDTAVLINTARGGVVDESALYRSLVVHSDRHAFLDVREQEPPLANDPLGQLANITLTPHVAGITRESSHRVATYVLEEVDKVLNGLPVT